MSNGLDPDQDRRSVGPDLGPLYCLQSYQQTTKVTTSKEKVSVMAYYAMNDQDEYIGQCGRHP